MKFLELPCLDSINRNLSYTTPEQQVFARCELYTTKSAGLDKKLYKFLNKHIEERYLNDLALSQSLSPPSPQSPTSPPYAHTLPSQSDIPIRQRRRSSVVSRRSSISPLIAPLDRPLSNGHNGTHGTQGTSLPAKITYGPFGPLDTVSSRKTLMYLIMTLNATHPAHDFTTISPTSFHRERHVRHTLSHILPPTNPGVQSEFFTMLDKELDWRMPNSLSSPHSHSSSSSGNGDCTVYNVDESELLEALPVGTVWCTTLFWVNRKLKRVLFLEVHARSITSPILEATDEMSDWDEIDNVLGEFEMDL